MIALGVTESFLPRGNQFSLLPLLIIGSPFNRNAQNLVSLVDLLDFGPAGRVIRMEIWMAFPD